MKKLEQLFEKKKKIGLEITERVKHLYPLGAVVKFNKGGNFIEAEVVLHSDWDARLRVLNLKTHKIYWIDVYPANFPEILLLPPL